MQKPIFQNRKCGKPSIASKAVKKQSNENNLSNDFILIQIELAQNYQMKKMKFSKSLVDKIFAANNG